MGLLETVISVGLMGAMVVFFISALASHSIATRSADANDVALNLVRTQLEVVKNATYAANYDSLKLTPPSGYTLTLTSPYVDANLAVSGTDTKLQLITVTVSRSGTTYLSVQMLKADV
ncbi:MAG: hypothetical protein HW403_1037 [Dehalococcoidia bacterium]|nr:hypothetical protein [Dehalococcoidia bacterium]